MLLPAMRKWVTFYNSIPKDKDVLRKGAKRAPRFILQRPSTPRSPPPSDSLAVLFTKQQHNRVHSKFNAILAAAFLIAHRSVVDVVHTHIDDTEFANLFRVRATELYSESMHFASVIWHTNFSLSRDAIDAVAAELSVDPTSSSRPV